LHIAK